MSLTPVTPTTSPYDISTQVAEFKQAYKGEDVRDGIINLANKLNNELNDMTEHEFVLVDDTLSVSGAGADAAATGTRIDTKMDKNNPSGTGSFSMNPKSGESMGQNAAALGDGSHAEAYASFAAGFNASVKLINSDGPTGAIALGYLATANAKNLIALGCANLEDSGGDSKLLVVGNGYLSGGLLHDSNAMTLDWDGNAWFAGGIKVGGADYEHGSELAPKSYVDSAIATAIGNAIGGSY